MCGLLGLIFLLGTSVAIRPNDSTHQLSEFNVIQEFGEQGSGLLDEGLRAIAYAEQLLDNVNSPAFKKIISLYKENEHRLESCEGSLAADLDKASACFCITGDIANLTQIAINSSYEVTKFFEELVSALKDMNDCQSQWFWKQVMCYKKAFEDFQAIIAKYLVRINELLANTTVVLQQLKIDIHNCFAHTNTTQFSERFEKNIAICKLKLI